MKKPFICVMFGIFMYTLFMAGFLWQARVEAADGCTNPCPTPTASNYKDCNEPGGCNNCRINALHPGTPISTADTLAIAKCAKDPLCNKSTGSRFNQQYDLNCDGFVNNIDSNIAARCLNCCATPSPFK